MRCLFSQVLAGFLLVLPASPVFAQAQIADQRLTNSDVEIHLLAAGGAALTTDAHVKLTPIDPGVDRRGRSIGNYIAGDYEGNSRHGVATIDAVDGGDYVLEVTAEGYQTHRERLTVLPGYGRTKAFVKLHLFDGSSDDLELDQPGAPPVAPNARRELELTLVALGQAKYKDASSHIRNALKAAPQNPEVHFVAGYVDAQQKDFAGARQEYEAAVTFFPNHFGAQLALGETLLFDGKSEESIPHLEKALAVGPNSWRGHWLLAEACLQGSHDMERVRSEAKRAFELGKDKATAALVTLAMADAVAGQRDAAREELQAFLHNYPSSQSADRAKQLLSQLESAASSAMVGLSAKDVDPYDLESVAPDSVPGLPASVDPAVPAVTEDVTCDLPHVLAGAAGRAQEFTQNLERFAAKELVIHALLDAKGVPKNPKDRTFDYVVSVDRTPAEFIGLNEMRDGSEFLTDYPGELAVEGVPALGVVFHPKMSGDFKFTCEGLGQRLGQPAWQVRFEQRSDRPARLHSWLVAGKEYPALLKGRAWISSDSYELLHVDVDLIQPILPLRLEYQHMSVDYAPVSFPSKQSALWLPSNVVVYCKYRGHYFRQEHNFSNFTLYSTGVDEKIGTTIRH